MKTIDVSTLGASAPIPLHPDHRVFSSGHVVTYRGNTPLRKIGGKNSAGYCRVTLAPCIEDTKSSHLKLGRYFVHRLVAQAFIPNPENLEEVDHIDGNKENNSVENLRWISRAGNMKAAFALKGNWLAKYCGATAQKTRRIDAETLEITYFDSALKAAKEMGNPRRAANICKAILTMRSAYGAYWSKASTPEVEALRCAKAQRHASPLKSASILQSAVSSSQDDPAPQPNE